jgi:hypothetical protein
MAAKIDTVTLVADTVATVTLTSDWDYVEVVNVDGASAVYFTTDGTAPTVAGDECFPLGNVANASRKVRKLKRSSETDTVVKLISAGTPTVTVIGS